MQSVAYGTYRNGQIFLDAPGPVVGESRVQVIFLSEEIKDSLMDIFDVLGQWEDSRDTGVIIASLRNTRVSSQGVSL